MSSRSLRTLMFVPVLAFVGLLGGCGETASKPPDFPSTPKAGPQASEPPKAAPKNLGRTGSEAGKPPER